MKILKLQYSLSNDEYKYLSEKDNFNDIIKNNITKKIIEEVEKENLIDIKEEKIYGDHIFSAELHLITKQDFDTIKMIIQNLKYGSGRNELTKDDILVHLLEIYNRK